MVNKKGLYNRRIRVVHKKVKPMQATAEKIEVQRISLSEARKLHKSMAQKTVEAGITFNDLHQETLKIFEDVKKSRRKNSR